MLPDWVYKDEIVVDISQFKTGAFGFVYEVTFNNGKKYLGCKQLYTTRTLKPLKGTRKKRKKTVESTWLKYCGSFKDEELKAQIKSGETFPIKREILHVCFTKRQLTYYETKYLFCRGCIEDTMYYNYHILGKFYSKFI